MLLDLEVPNADDVVPEGRKPLVHPFVTFPVRGDLVVPERTRLAVVVVRMPMPERAVHEHCDAPRLPDQVRPTRKPLVESPASDACRPERRTERDFGCRVPRLYAGHESTPLL